MNKKISSFSILMVLITISFLSCTKIIDWKNLSHKSPRNGCDVAEYHLPYYDSDPLTFPFLFKKKYDPTGKIVTEIDCSFWNLNSPQRVARNELVLDHKAGSLFLLDKNNLSDTVMFVYFDSNGRVKSLIGTDKLINFEEKIRSNRFFYTNNRLAAVETMITDAGGNATSQIDSIYYDSYGNILSFRRNSYQYDYTRKASQQFYIDEYIEYNNGYYLLQYLGFFPEVTGPVHVRTRVETTIGPLILSNHSFDADNRLTSYQVNNFGKATITYNCK